MMFNKLVASHSTHSSFWNPKTISLSAALHALLIAGAVYASVQAPREAEKKVEEVTFMEIEDKPPEPPRPAEPPPPPPQASVEPPPAPKGFQELIPPDIPPPNIPEPDFSEPVVNPEDFSGVGVAGGRADGVEGAPAPQDSTFAYSVAVLERQPALDNLRQVQRSLSRNYPRMLERAGVSGTVVMRFVITPDGKVDPASVEVISTTHEQFAEATIKALEDFRFRPGRYQGQDVRVLIQMPITWQVQR